MTGPSFSGVPAVGTTFEPTRLTIIDAEAVAAYARASGDNNPIHLDEAAAKKAGLDGPIAHGMLMMGRLEAPVREWLPGWRITIKRGGGGRETRTYWGPLGEHTHSHATALALSGLCPPPP